MADVDVMLVKTRTVRYFSAREEALANLLIRLGTKKNVALVLTYLASEPEATSWQIERGTDLRQPEVSVAMRYLKDRDWIDRKKRHSATKGRPLQIYNLSRPFTDIIRSIGEEKKSEARDMIELTQKLRQYAR